MPSLAARLASAWLRRRVKPRLAAASDLHKAAEALNLRLPCTPPPRPAQWLRIGGIEGEWIDAPPPAATLLYLHGGAYFTGSPQHCRPITHDFARRGFRVFAPAYRLAPKYPFPAAVEDVKAVYDAILSRGARTIVLAGDSAGGGLALALMIALRDAGARLPKAAVLFSPWTDLAVTGASARANDARDPLFSRKMLKIAARHYLAGASPRQPLASPLYADLSGLPPLLIHVGADEVLRDDATRLIERARAAGTRAECEVWPSAPHCWQLGAAFMPEARRSLDRAAAFLRLCAQA